MEGDSASMFINTIVRNIQMLCHAQVPFNQNVEVIGHLYLNIDSNTKLNYIVNEKCSKINSSTTFTSNSFHAEPGNVIHSENSQTEQSTSPSKTLQKKTKRSERSPRKSEKSPKRSKLAETFENVQTPDAFIAIDKSLGVTFSQHQEDSIKMELSTPDGIIKIEVEDNDIDDTADTADTTYDNNDTSLEGGGEISYEDDSLSHHQSPLSSQQYSTAIEEQKVEVDDYVDDDVASQISYSSECVRQLRSVADVQIPETAVEYTIVEMGTKQGKPMLVDSIGYSYTMRKETNACARWWCSVRNKVQRCPATVAQRGDCFKRGAMEHVHDATPGLLTSTIVRAEVRNQATNDFITPTAEVVERAMSVKGVEDDGSSLPKQSNLKRMINRHRQILRNKIFS